MCLGLYILVEHSVKSSLTKKPITECLIFYSSDLGRYHYKIVYLFGNHLNHC